MYELLHQEVAHLQRLVEDLRTLSLADAGELSLHRRAVDPKALLERAGLAHVVSARQKNIALRVDAPETLPSVVVDVERMTQVLNNLITNALRFTSQGQIVLSASSRSEWVTLQVADSGIGISPEELGNVFNRFYRGDSSRHRDGQAQSRTRPGHSQSDCRGTRWSNSGRIDPWQGHAILNSTSENVKLKQHQNGSFTFYK